MKYFWNSETLRARQGIHTHTQLKFKNVLEWREEGWVGGVGGYTQLEIQERSRLARGG
jgi:hypothetical protein